MFYFNDQCQTVSSQSLKMLYKSVIIIIIILQI